MPPNPSALIEVMDDAVPADLFNEASRVCQNGSWRYGHGSTKADGSRFWKMDLEGNAVFDSIWQHVRPRCEELAGAPLRVVRQYANGHTYGQGGRPHWDDKRPGTFTFLYYPVPEWQDEWEGETIYYGDAGEIVKTVKLRPNRAVFFDSRIPHAGRGPGRACSALRVSVAYKLETEAAALHAADEAKPQEAEIPAEGPARASRIRLPAEVVSRAVGERLANLAKNVKLPGFRDGKIPESVLERRYGAEARSDAIHHLTLRALEEWLKKGIVPSGVRVASGQISGDVEIEISGTCLAELPSIDFSKVPVERLTASAAVAAEAGLTPEEAGALLRTDIKGQMLDRLNAAYPIPILPLLVERELAAIWKANAASPDLPAKRGEFRPIAERRLRLGWIVAELARRFGIGASSGPELEDRVIDHLVSLAPVEECEATAVQLRELLED